MDQLSGNAGKQLVRSLLSEALEGGWAQLIERCVCGGEVL